MSLSLAPFGRLRFTLLNRQLNIADCQDLKMIAHNWPGDVTYNLTGQGDLGDEFV